MTSPIAMGELATRVLEAIETDSKLAKLNGPDMIAALNAASHIVTETITAQAFTYAITKTLGGDYEGK